MGITSETPISLRDKRFRSADPRGFGSPDAGLRRRAAMADASRGYLSQLWEQATAGRWLEGVALAATGSLARGDSGPLSDLDLVLIHEGRLRERDLAAIADALWYPLWDSGIALDHSVRSLQQCRQVAGDDLSAAVALLDLDLIAGDPEVVAGVRSSLSHDWRANARRRLPEVRESVLARHQRVGEIAQTLAPDLKEGKGGLRDLTVLRALTAAWLADRPRGAVDRAYGDLLDVRDALHIVTGRSRTTLHLQDQDAVAALLGLPDADALLTTVAAAARTIGHALDGTMRRAAQSQRARTPRIGPRRPQLTPLGYGLFAHDGEVVLGPRADPGGDPLLPLRTAVIAARAGLPIGPTTAANLARHTPDLSQPWPAAARDLWCDLLASGPGLVQVWEDLDQVGLISRWLPEWDGIRNRPQRNGIHRHTVDRHTLEAVVTGTGLVRAVDRPDLLVMGLLLHDIGKRPGAGEHSDVGAPIARQVMTRLGFDPEDVATVELLVRHHLTLIDLATRRDPHEPATVQAAAQAVRGSAPTLELLRQLTEADARAAGDAAWTSWRATLLDQLTAVTRAHLSDAGSSPRDTAAQPVTVPSHAREAVAAGSCWVQVTGESTEARLRVVAADRVGLFADTAGLLAALRLVVRAAAVHTVDGVAVDEWQISSPTGDTVDPTVITRALNRLAAGDRAPLSSLTRPSRVEPTASSRASFGSPGQSRVLVLPDAAPRATVLEVRAGDRPGLLHDLGRALAQIRVSVRSAHVATYAGQTLDTFYLTEPDGGLLAPGRVAATVSALIAACDALNPE